MTLYKTPSIHMMPSFFFRAVVMALLLVGLSSPVQAQDNQAYKKEYNAGLEAYKANQLDKAHAHWTKAAQLAATAGDADIAKKSKYYVAQLDYKRGIASYKAEKYEEAIKHHQAGTKIYPDYAKNLYGEAMALKKLNRIDDALAKFKSVVDTSKDRKTVIEAQERLQEHFYYEASSAVSKQNATRADADRALASLEASKTLVEPGPDFYYYSALAYSIKGDTGQAIAMINKALELHRGSKADKAKIYFVKGEVLLKTGDVAGAKDAFTNAAFGEYKASAEHYIQSL